MNLSDPLLAIFHTWIELFMHRSMRSVIRYSKEKHISMSQLGALSYIHHKGACGVSKIGESLNVTSAAASQLLERLVQQGLVERSEDPHDRRSKHIVLTDKGQQIMQESLHTQQDWLENLIHTLSPEERTQVTVTLTLLVEKIRSLDD